MSLANRAVPFSHRTPNHTEDKTDPLPKPWMNKAYSECCNPQVPSNWARDASTSRYLLISIVKQLVRLVVNLSRGCTRDEILLRHCCFLQTSRMQVFTTAYSVPVGVRPLAVAYWLSNRTHHTLFCSLRLFDTAYSRLPITVVCGSQDPFQDVLQRKLVFQHDANSNDAKLYVITHHKELGVFSDVKRPSSYDSRMPEK